MVRNCNSKLERWEGAVRLPRFESIRKLTVSETYQYFIKLIQGKYIENLSECLTLSTDLSLFDESLRLLLIDHLQLENEVLKILLSQNEYQIKRILQCKWFFKKLPVEVCTKQIFPYVSVSLRCKIINRLSKYLESTEEAEKYFTFIRANYENKIAHYILSRCSSKFILAYVESSKQLFDYNTGLRVLLNISRKYPEVGIYIMSIGFDINKGNNPSLVKYKKIIRYLAGYHPDLVVPLIKKHSTKIFYNVFGHKLTKKLGPKLGEDLFTVISNHLLFREHTLFSVFCFEERVRYIAAFICIDLDNIYCDSWPRSLSRISSLLKVVHKQERLPIIEAVFKEVYNLNFNECSKAWLPKILELLPKNVRLTYVRKLIKFLELDSEEFDKNVNSNFYPRDSPQELYLLYDSRIAFEKLKEILKETPELHKRREILFYLVENCSMNEDIEVLQEVSEYVATRHRNDHHSLIFSVLDNISKLFPPSALNSTIYEKLEDLARFCCLKDHRNDDVLNFWRERHIYYRLENNMNVNDHLENLFRSAILGSSCSYTFVHELKSKNAKVLIVALCKMTVNWIRSHSSKSASNIAETLLMKVLNTCNEYNKLRKRTRIFLKDIPGLEEVLREKMKKMVENVCEEFYREDLISNYKVKCLFFVFKRNLDLIQKHFKKILKIFSEYNIRENIALFIFFMKAVSFFGKTEEVKEMILNDFKTGDSIQKRKNALKLYSRICTIEEYTKAVEDYFPRRDTIEQRRDEGFDEIQILVPSLIKHVRPRWKNFELIFEFFHDFLHIVLPSLYSCCFSTRSDVIVPFLKEKLNALPARVSYVKDIIRLIFELSDRTGRSDFYLNLWDEYKHYTVRCILLEYISRSFLEQPTRDSFQVLQNCILGVDEKTISKIPHLYQIPNEFLNDYVSVLWGKPKVFYSNYFGQTLLCHFNVSNIGLLSPELCESIIKRNLFNSPLGISIDEFTVVYLSAEPEAVERRVLMLLDLIKNRKPKALFAFNFFNVLIERSKEKSPVFADIFTIILNNWPDIYPLGVLGELRVLMTYHSLYQKVLKTCDDPDIIFKEFGKELKELYSTIDNLNYLLVIYIDTLKLFFDRFQTLDVIVTVRKLVEVSRDRAVTVIAILCLPNEAVVWFNKEDDDIAGKAMKGKKLLNEIAGIVEGLGDDVVLFYFRSKFEFVKE